MTVKELREFLETCNQENDVVVVTDINETSFSWERYEIEDCEQVQYVNGTEVVELAIAAD